MLVFCPVHISENVYTLLVGWEYSQFKSSISENFNALANRQ
jgi:hypothetical protein